ncbi:MAG: hypothetical protein NVV63_18430 [Opitutus sp.]|nr:hypothetical protein [Opitutus sp.]
MKKPFFYTFLAIFAATAALTLLGMADVVKIKDGYLNALFGGLILELITAMIGLFRSTRFFDDSLYQNLDDYQPSRDASRLLHTLIIHQEKMDSGLKSKFGLVVSPGGGDFPRYLSGLAELVGLGLVDIEPGKWMCFLTSTGFQVAQRLRKKIEKVEPFIV